MVLIGQALTCIENRILQQPFLAVRSPLFDKCFLPVVAWNRCAPSFFLVQNCLQQFLTRTTEGNQWNTLWGQRKSENAFRTLDNLYLCSSWLELEDVTEWVVFTRTLLETLVDLIKYP